MGKKWMAELCRLAMLSALGLHLLGWSVLGQEPAPPPAELIPYAQDSVPNAPRSPEEAVRAMTVPPGFRVEVVASEPDIVNPVAMTFDERGRIWITESLEYPRHEPGPGRDRVKTLEDTDGDGKADRFTVFADGLNIPSGIAVGHGGVWVANAPDILFLKDTDGDGKADSKEVVVTGFGRYDTHELPNSLTWGPDGWLYGWNGVFNPSKIVSRNGKTYEFTCAIFRIHPRTRTFELFCEGTSNPWGIAIDAEGSFFSSACVIDHLWHLAETGYYIRQGGPYPPFTWPMRSIVNHKHQKAAYCGIHYFDSPAYPPEYRGRLYMGNIHGNAVNVDVPERHGSTYSSRPAPDLLRANDAWFMPVVQKTGPDGCLYILDWYDRYHCYQDANRDPAGIDRLKGRLYRIRYGETPRRVGFDLAKGGDDEWIRLLGSPNVYDRDIAQRLLTERASEHNRARLEAIVLDSQTVKTTRMHALWCLVGSGPLDPSFHSRLLAHPDPTIRAWGVRAAGNQRNPNPGITEKVVALARDEAPDVRLQVAIAARKLSGIDPLPVLIEVLSTSMDDPLLPRIVWQNLHPLLETRQGDFARRLDSMDPKVVNELSPILARAIGRILDGPTPDPATAARLLARVHEERDVAASLDLVARLFRENGLPPSVQESLRRELRPVLGSMAHGPRPALSRQSRILLAYCGDQQAVAFARNLAGMPSSPDVERLRAFQAVCSVDPPSEVRKLVRQLLDERGAVEPSGFLGQLIDTLPEREDPALASVLIEGYPRLGPELQPRAIEVLTDRPTWSRSLIAAVASKRIPASALNLNQIRKLMAIKDPDVATQVRSIWGTIREGRNRRREQVVGQIRGMVRRTTGDPLAGRAVFKKLCAQCHKIHGDGVDVGPDLTANGRNDFDQLLSNVFDPSLVIGPAYQATTIATSDGRIFTGLVAEDTAEHVVLKLQGGKVETIPRREIDEAKLSSLSLMPEEIENQLTPREIADLIAFLSLDKPPEDPSARPLPGAGPIARRSK